jgi:hypothetical protein
VQIAEYARGRQRIVEHVGPAHTEAELGMLLERAGELLDNPAQGVLELGIEPTPPVKGLVVPAGQGLFDALAGVFTTLGFDGLGDEVFRDLVIARVVEPTSLLDAGRILRDLGQSPASYATMKRTLSRAAAGKYCDRIATWCFQHASTSYFWTLRRDGHRFQSDGFRDGRLRAAITRTGPHPQTRTGEFVKGTSGLQPRGRPRRTLMLSALGP